MILYCDTSALIKRYVEEAGSGRVNELWDAAEGIATSVVAFAETVAALNRKRRDGVLTAREFARTMAAWKRDYDNIILVPVDGSLNERIEHLARTHPLRGFDAIHLASALVIRSGGKIATRFACFDRTLNNAATSEGLDVAVA
jgi:predicted nucleic acid-binding protein